MKPKKRIIPVFIPNAGCAHKCVFCDQRRITGASANASAAVVADIISAAIREMKRSEAAADSRGAEPGPYEIAFYGGSFTALPEPLQNELLESACGFLRPGPRDSIRISTRPDCLGGITAERLKRFGVGTVELGAQSMCDDVLRMSRRGHTAADVVEASLAVKGAGLSLILQMMTGLPGDTRLKSLDTAKRFTEMQPDGVRVYPTVVVRGTELYEMWKRGEYTEHTLEDAITLCAEICRVFNDASIPILRLGLNPTDALSAGDAAAGAYHPALGQLVYSKLYYDIAAGLLKSAPPHSEVIITVAKGRGSVMTGSRRGNIDRLLGEFSLASVKVAESDALQSPEKPVSVQIFDRRGTRIEPV